MKALTENGHVSLTNRLVHMYTESSKTKAECGWQWDRKEALTAYHLQRITTRSWYKRKYLQWYTSWIPRYWHPGTHASRFEKTYPIYCHYLVMMQIWNRTTKSLVIRRFQCQASCTPHIYRCFKFAKLYDHAKPFKFHGCCKC